MSSSSSKSTLHKEQPMQKERVWSDVEGHQVQKAIYRLLMVDPAQLCCFSEAASWNHWSPLRCKFQTQSSDQFASKAWQQHQTYFLELSLTAYGSGTPWTSDTHKLSTSMHQNSRNIKTPETSRLQKHQTQVKALSCLPWFWDSRIVCHVFGPTLSKHLHKPANQNNARFAVKIANASAARPVKCRKVRVVKAALLLR